MAQKIDGLTLANYANDGFQEIMVPNYSKNYTLDATLHVDFFNGRLGWRITFDILTAAQFTALKAKYNKQFTNNTFLRFEDDEMGINLDVFMSMPDDRNIKWRGAAVKDLTITLEPQHADDI